MSAEAEGLHRGNGPGVKTLLVLFLGASGGGMWEILAHHRGPIYMDQDHSPTHGLVQVQVSGKGQSGPPRCPVCAQGCREPSKTGRWPSPHLSLVPHLSQH